MCGLLEHTESPKNGKHRELSKAEIANSEAAVQGTTVAIKNFTNPFSVPDKGLLCIIASGAPVPSEFEKDVLNAEKTGKKAKQDFIQERFVENSFLDTFFNSIQKNKLKTMEISNRSVKMTSSQGKVSPILTFNTV